MLVVFDMVGERTKGTVDLVEEGRRSDVNELYRPKSGSGVMYAKCFAEGGPGCSGSSTIEILMNEKIIGDHRRLSYRIKAGAKYCPC